MTRKAQIFLLLPLVLALGLGCAPKTAKLQGKVTYKGAPVTAGTVTFHTPTGGIFPYGLHADGTFSGFDMPPGDYVVTVETETANPKGHKDVTYGGAKNKEGAADPNQYKERMMKSGQIPETVVTAGPYVPIPKKYASKDKSPLKKTLSGGSNEVNLDLED
jgi:hypothetical protein